MHEPRSETDIAAAAGELVEISGRIGAGNLSVRLTAALERFRKDSIRVAVFGEYKRGKSTFINALLGRAVLPMGVLPLTTVPTLIEHGQPEGVLVQFRDRLETYPLDRLGEFVSEKQNPQNILEVESLSVHIQSPMLERGLQIVDTPGFGSTHLHNSECAESYLPNADAGLMVLGASPPMGQAEREFLGKAKQFASSILFVQNKADQMEKEDLREAMAFNASIIESITDIDSAKIYAVSALEGLHAKVRGDAAEFDRSGMKAIEQCLEEVALKKREIGEAALRNAIQSLATDLLSQLDMEERLTRFEHEDLNRRIEVFQRSLRELDVIREENLVDLKQATRRHVLERLDSDLEAFKAAEFPKLVSDALQMLRSQTNPTLAVRALNANLPKRLISVVDEWAVIEHSALQGELRQRLEKGKSSLLDIASSVAGHAESAFEMKLSPPSFEVAMSEEVRYDSRSWEVKLNWSPTRWTLSRLLGRAAMQHRLEAQARELCATQLEMHCGRLRYDLVTRLDRATDEYLTQLEEVCVQYSQKILGAAGRALMIAGYKEQDARNSGQIREANQREIEALLRRSAGGSLGRG
jgi:GTP-binding protein EngB required for normal cell division